MSDGSANDVLIICALEEELDALREVRQRAARPPRGPATSATWACATRRWGDSPKAIEYLERSLAINEQLGRIEGQAHQLANLGLCNEQLGKPATAKDLLTRAGALFRRMGLPDDHPRVAKVERALARLR